LQIIKQYDIIGSIMSGHAEVAPVSRETTVKEHFGGHQEKKRGFLRRSLDALGLTAAAIGFMSYASGLIGMESTTGVEHAYFMNAFNGGLIATAAGLGISLGVQAYSKARGK